MYDRKQEKNYIRLFNVIRKENISAEKQLAVHPGVRHFAGNLNYEKHRLSELILDTLISRQPDAFRSEISNELRKIETLRTRRMYQAALSRLKKLKKKAYSKECFEELLLIIEQEIRFRHLADSSEDYLLPALSAEKLEILKTLSLFESIRRFRFDFISLLSEKGSPRDDLRRAEFQSYGAQLQQWLDRDDLPVTARDELYRAAISYHNSMLDYAEAYRYNVLRDELFARNEFLVEKNPEAYIQFLYLFAMNNFSVGRQADGMRNFNDLKAYADRLDAGRDLHLRTFVRLRIVPLEMYIHCIDGNSDALLANDDKYRIFVEEYEQSMPLFRKNSFCYNLAQAYFIAKKYDKAKAWANLVVNNPKSKTDFELYFYPLILLVVIYLEEGEDLPATGILRSLERHISLKKGQSLVFERDLLKFLKKLNNYGLKPEKQAKREFAERAKKKGMKLEQHPFLDEWLLVR